MKIKIVTMFLCLTGFISAVIADGSVITDVRVSQYWPWSRLVHIDYVVTNGDAPFDVHIQAVNGDLPLRINPFSLSGDIHNVSGTGKRRIVWDPTIGNYESNLALAQFRVELIPRPIPLYMIIDLTKTPGTNQQVEYVYEEDLINGDWGSFVVDPITNLGTVISSVIWTGVTNDIYKTDKLVLRRISAGSFMLNDNKYTEITKDFYIGVFHMTQRQWELITGKRPSHFNHDDCYATRTLEYVSYGDLRGSHTNDYFINWPATGHKVAPDSSLQIIRQHTGVDDFDLPTEAQWEYACRAGTTTYYYDGLPTPEDTTNNTQADVLGRYKSNGGRYLDEDGVYRDPKGNIPHTDNGTCTVGTYLPNAWGLYDMVGSAHEWCLDWYATVTGGVDPVGPVSVATNEQRVYRGGGWWQAGFTLRSAYRNAYYFYFRGSDTTVRLVRHLQ